MEDIVAKKSGGKGRWPYIGPDQVRIEYKRSPNSRRPKKTKVIPVSSLNLYIADGWTIKHYGPRGNPARAK